VRVAVWDVNIDGADGTARLNWMDAAADRYADDALVDFARTLLARAGVRDDIAGDVASILVDGELLGHTTHGLALLPAYLGEIER